MSLILHHKDPANITKPERYNVDKDTNLLDWMCEKWSDSEKMSDGLSTSVLLNGKVIFTTDSEEIDESLLDFTLGEYDVVSIVNRPAGVVAIVIVAIVVAVAISLALAPSLPGDSGEQTESPNNALQAATNRFRPGEARPEIFGSIVSYPDFLQPTYFEYENNLKIVYELGYIGEGRYEIGEVRNGETPFSSIPGSSFTIYEPGETIPADILTIHRPADPVDGQVLPAPDDESIQQLGEIDSISGGGGTSNIVLTMIEGSTIVSDLDLAVGGYVSLSDAIMVFNINTGGMVSIGTFEIINISIVAQRSVIELGTMGSFTTPPDEIYIASTDQNGVAQNFVGFFDIPGKQAEEVWINWQMPQGIRKESGKQLSITLQFQIESLDRDGVPTGNMFTKTETITGKTLDPQFRTTKFTPAEFPGMTVSQYRARAARVTRMASGAASQQVKLETFESVTPYASLDNSKGTVISWQRRATTFALSSSGNKNNLDVTRKLPTYNRVTGEYDINNLQATRDFADAAAYTLIVASQRSTTTIDLEGLYDVNDGLLHPELGYFDFTFDNKNVGLGERIESICNVARVSPFKSGGVWGFTRDEIKPVRTAMFNRRVTVGNSSKQSWLLQRPDDKDSVELTYVDPTLNVEKILYRRIDENGNITDDGRGRQALEIKLAGCRNFFQAWNRINVEMRRLVYQRRTVTDTTLRDGMIVGLLERVGWVDPNDISSFSGEILSFTGSVYETSERFEPVDGESYVVYITDDEGNTSNTVTATPRDDTEFGFIADGLSGAFLSEPSGNQLGSRYFIAAASDISASDFLLTSRKPKADGTTDIEMVEYAPEMYELDNANPPQPSVNIPEMFNIINITSEPDDSTAELSVTLDGFIVASGGINQGYINEPVDGMGVNFETRLTQESGDTIEGAELGVWLPVTENRTWTVTKDGATEGRLSATATLEIRDSSFTENIGVTTAMISAVVGGNVTLPVSAEIRSFGFNAPSMSTASFLSNGTYRFIGDSTTIGNYIDTADNIGDNYEIMTSISSGDDSDLFGSPLDVWITLSGSGVSWSVRAETGFNTSTANITVQIREIANNLNINSVALSLIAESEL